MDTEQSAEVLDASETPQQEDAVMEKEEKPETTAEPTEPENPPAAVEETEQLAVNGHATEVVSMKETEEPPAVESMTQEIAEMTIEDSLEKSGMESVPCEMAPPEPDESSEKVSDPVAALTAEPENTEQQPVPENNPEPLAERVPEPEPEKLAESVPETELQEQTSPIPAAVQQPVDVQPPSPEEKVLEKVETEKEPQTAMEPEAKKEATATETVLVTEDSSKEPTEAATGEKEASAGIESGDSAQDAKEVNHSDTEPAAPKGAEAAAEDEDAKSEQKAEPQKDEDAAPASGSLSFALLEQEQTRDTLQISRTLVVLRGLPGSGLSFLARAIADSYKNQCSVICADDHGVMPENPESCADGYKALDEAVVACCSEAAAASVLIVVDDTNHTHDRLARLGEIAEEHHLVPIFLEPQTEWSRDVAQLKKKTKRGLEEAQLEAMKAPLEETSLPLYFGWFFLSSIEEKVRCTSMDFLKTLDTLDAFKKHLSEFTGKPEKEVDLEQYFKSKGTLHCTTKFCNYGKAEGAKEYAQIPAVKNSYGSVFELSMTALFVTPRTVGAKVSLIEEQLQLWPADAEKEVEADVPAAATMPPGSRAHVTLGCADGVEPVQTGIDLLQILALQQEGQQGEQVEEMELGSLAYYGEGRWLLSLREPIRAPACFSSFYGPKELEPTKKDPEKKKKQKCTIL